MAWSSGASSFADRQSGELSVQHVVRPCRTGSSTGLPDAPYRAAADAINNLATALPQTPAGSPAADLGVTSDVVFLRAVPAWETEAL
ncbi:hypothetical protein OG930_43310 [Streptomyces sp. NBC_01799]|uniref:hypothetical protein n=1 Tax=Streptomyces sp. NBC_01800 TaxID=2975945 RepID=UPI002DD8A33A|nr:hypothetical protein [Streptomyces sp. NBC_01800]WSA73213.1 hypothetical protein OIE65_43950 [Streptomyces sp. NBC_01800]WSA81730.1 hypothetical protein OG930_43310 [Streptomyces sp. NBC_01799]